MGPTWGPSGTDRAQVGPMLAPWTLLNGISTYVHTVTVKSYERGLCVCCVWLIQLGMRHIFSIRMCWLIIRQHENLFVNPLSSTDVYKRQWSGLKLVQVMACRLFACTWTNHGLSSIGHPRTNVNETFESNYQSFYFRTYIWKYRLQNIPHLSRGLCVKFLCSFYQHINHTHIHHKSTIIHTVGALLCFVVVNYKSLVFIVFKVASLSFGTIT